MALKKCKECGEEVSSGAKVCPKCGKDQRNFFMKHKFITFILVVVVIVAISSMGSSGNTAKVEPGKNNVQTTVKIGDKITTGNYEITITSVKTAKKVGVEYFNTTPSEGGIFVVVDWKYKNISAEPKGMFEFPSLQLVDQKGTVYSSDVDASSYYAMQTDPDRKVLSDLNPGITVKDSSVFEISKTAYATGTWTLNVDADKDAVVKVK